VAATPRRSLQAISSRWRQLAPAALVGDPSGTVVSDAPPAACGTTLPLSPLPLDCASGERPTTRTIGINLTRWMGEAGRGLRLVRRLAQGGHAVILLAHQECVSRDVVVKVAPPELRNDPAIMRNLTREAAALARLRHPGIPSVFDAGPGFVVMTSIIGRSFEDALHPGQPAGNLLRAVQIVRQVATIVEHAHEQRILHRDLKPGNVLIDTDGEAWLVDWGLALDLHPAADGQLRIPPTPAHLLCAGTPVYLSPEAARADGEQLGAASDLFQLGGMLYRVLTGHPPFAADDAARAVDRAAMNRWTPITGLAPQAPRHLVLAAHHAMDGDPARRGTVAGFGERLDAWLHAQQRPTPVPAVAEPEPEPEPLPTPAPEAPRPATGFWSKLGRLLRPPRAAGG
jgi:serine/threonine protein kinase